MLIFFLISALDSFIKVNHILNFWFVPINCCCLLFLPLLLLLLQPDPQTSCGFSVCRSSMVSSWTFILSLNDVCSWALLLVLRWLSIFLDLVIDGKVAKLFSSRNWLLSCKSWLTTGKKTKQINNFMVILQWLNNEQNVILSTIYNLFYLIDLDSNVMM